MGMKRGYIFHLGTLQLSSLSPRCVNQCAVCCDLSGKEELLFITTSPERPLFTEREGGKADSTKKVPFCSELSAQVTER